MQYKEEQRFNQWWLWIILIGLNLIPAYGMYQQVFKGRPFGNHPLPDGGLLLLQLFTVLFLLVFWQFRLKTEINETFIMIKFHPFVNKTILWKNVMKARIVNYGFVGGWGIRLTSKYGLVYNTSGNWGLLLELSNGKKICVGTQRPEEVAALIPDQTKT